MSLPPLPSGAPHAAVLARQRAIALADLLLQLPPCCEAFFRAIADQTQELTRLNYAYDLRLFFQYVIKQLSTFSGMELRDITPECLRRLTTEDIERFLADITYYEKDGLARANHHHGKGRKLSAIRTLLQFWFERDVLDGNVGAKVHRAKTRETTITRLSEEEVAELLDTAELGGRLTPTQQAFHQKTAARDAAILTLFLGTGMRISELCGINLNDHDAATQTIRITRKGGKQAIIYYGDEVAQALAAWQSERDGIEPLPGHENALFLSLQRRRITPRSVENLVGKYAKIVSPLKNISPHKLRSTYGTALYRNTGDIYLVAEVLGHKDVNTTRKHYAAMDEDRKRDAANAVPLRMGGARKKADDD